MEIFLVRHTTPKIDKGICYGQSDLPLVDNFSIEFNEILNEHPYLLDTPTIYSSPLQRCKQLAETLGSQNIQFDSRIQELNFGDWELQEWDAINPADMKKWMEDFVNEPVPNGESFVDLNNRVLSFKDDLLLTEPEGQVVIVTHAGVIRSLLSYANETPLAKAFEYKVAYGEVFKIEVR